MLVEARLDRQIANAHKLGLHTAAPGRAIIAHSTLQTIVAALAADLALITA